MVLPGRPARLPARHARRRLTTPGQADTVHSGQQAEDRRVEFALCLGARRAGWRVRRQPLFPTRRRARHHVNGLRTGLDGRCCRKFCIFTEICCARRRLAPDVDQLSFVYPPMRSRGTSQTRNHNLRLAPAWRCRGNARSRLQPARRRQASASPSSPLVPQPRLRAGKSKSCAREIAGPCQSETGRLHPAMDRAPNCSGGGDSASGSAKPGARQQDFDHPALRIRSSTPGRSGPARCWPRRKCTSPWRSAAIRKARTGSMVCAIAGGDPRVPRLRRPASPCCQLFLRHFPALVREEPRVRGLVCIVWPLSRWHQQAGLPTAWTEARRDATGEAQRETEGRSLRVTRWGRRRGWIRT